MKLLLRFSLLLFIFFLSSAVSFAQEYTYHKVYIYNFTKYIQWPVDKQKGEFIIGVYGKSSMTKELETMAANRLVGSQKIVVKQIDGITEAADCHVLFIPSSKSSNLSALKSQLDGKSILFITEKNGMAKEGSDINFILVDGKLKYEMNKASLEKSGLKVMPDLVKLAILVNG
jgi:hypothetical protein